jgi:hypothetical protein
VQEIVDHCTSTQLFEAATVMPIYTRSMTLDHLRRRRSTFTPDRDDSNGFRQPAMSEEKWRSLSNDTTMHGNPAISPAAFKEGPPPDPRPSDSYANKWLKLVWMELYDSLVYFKSDQARKRESFRERATLSVTLGRYDDYRREYQVVIEGNDASKRYALPAEVSAADFVNALLRLEPGSGWVYVKRVDTTGGGPVTAFAHYYDDGFVRSEAGRPYRQPCVLFESFSGCLARFHALHRYPTVDASVRAAIEACSALSTAPPASAPVLRPFPRGRQSKLNESQLFILKNVREPVDFAQGPPGTGKSTFIVELLHVSLCHTLSLLYFSGCR